MKTCTTILLVLLVAPLPGRGQQQPASDLESVFADAQRAQAAGDFATAVNDYQRAIKMRPGIPQLWANLGLVQHQSGDAPAAIQSFQHALRLDPSLYVPNLFLGIEYAHIGKAKEAVPYLLAAEKIDKNDPQAALALGRTYIALNKFAAAAAELERATRLAPKLGAAWFTLGIARLDEVESDARIMSEEGKTSPFSGALYAESLARQARFGESASLYKTLLDARPQPPCMRSEYGFALLRGHDEPGATAAFDAERAAHPECALALLGQARMALDHDNIEKAAHLLATLWNRDHGFVQSNATLLVEGMAQDKTLSVASSLVASPLLAPDLHGLLAATLNVADPNVADSSAGQSPTASASGPRRTAAEDYAAGQFEQCAQRFSSALAPSSTAQLRLLAACSYFTGDNRRASGAAAALRAKEPHSIEALYWSVQANERLASDALARFQQLDPDSARSHILLGDIYQQLERYDDSQTEYLKAVSLAPGDPAAQLGLATAYLNNKNPNGAMAIAQAALLRRPQDPELNLIAAEVLMGQREYAAAVPYLFKSLNAKAQMLPRIHALIGKAYAETGRTQEAIEELKRGASSDVDGSVQYLLSRLYREIGDTKDATDALNQMKAIKQQRAARGYKQVQDPDLSPLEASANPASVP